MQTSTVLKVAAVAGAGYVGWRIVATVRDKVAAGTAVAGAVLESAKEILTTDLNPASDKNVVYRAVNAVGGTVSGDEDFSLGSKLWEVFNPDKVAKENALTAPTPAAAVAPTATVSTQAPKSGASSLWDWFPTYHAVQQMASTAAQSSSLPEQVNNIYSSAESFRAAEISDQNAAVQAAAEAESGMAKRKADFRLDEIKAQNGGYKTSGDWFDNWFV